MSARAKVLATACASLLAAWAISYFGPGLWSEAKEAAGEDPLQVTVLPSDEFSSGVEAEHGGQYVWPPDSAEVTQRARAWITGEGESQSVTDAHEQGAVDAATTLVRLQLRASGSEPVTIHDISVSVSEREEPLAGYFFTGDQGGVAQVPYLQVSLDEERVTWMDPTTGSESAPQTLYVTESDLEYVDVLARAVDCLCTWQLVLTYTTADGEDARAVVGPSEGGSFHTTGLGNAATVHAPLGCTTPPGATADLCRGLPRG